jgi:hypothetical protein
MDPFLEAHRLTRHCYVASGPAPISIRDQYHRGITLVERLHESEEISATRPLLIVGAGVAGVAAAIRAATLGVPTHLCDRATQPFRLQRDALSRHIDPCVYDWPVDHFDQGLAPPIHAPALLNLKADMASAQAVRWTQALRDAVRQFGGRLAYHPDIGIKPIAVLKNSRTGAEWLRVRLGATETREFAAVIWAASSKFEKTRLMSEGASPQPIFEGIWFWAADEVVSLGRADRVLISGAGDGALQDYLRAVTGRDDVREILAQLPIPDVTLRRLQSAEDRAHRGRVWFPDILAGGTPAQVQTLKRHEERWLRPLDALHRAEAAKLVSDPAVTAAIGRLIGHDLEGNARVPPVVHLVHRTAYLTPYYGVNRFLARVLDAYLIGRPGGSPTLFPGASIRTVVDAERSSRVPLFPPKRAFGGYAGRFGLQHKVTFAGKGPRAGMYNVIIIRHGHDDDGRKGIDTLLRSRKQLLPFFCP